MSFLTDAWLKAHGQTIEAVITNVSGTSGVFKETKGIYAGNPNVAANAYIITAVWTDPVTQNEYTFEKRYMADQPPHYKEGQRIAVLINPENPQQYKMEVAE